MCYVTQNYQLNILNNHRCNEYCRRISKHSSDFIGDTRDDLQGSVFILLTLTIPHF